MPVCCCEEVRIFPRNLILACQQTINFAVKLYISSEIELSHSCGLGLEVKKIQRSEQDHFFVLRF